MARGEIGREEDELVLDYLENEIKRSFDCRTEKIHQISNYLLLTCISNLNTLNALGKNQFHTMNTFQRTYHIVHIFILQVIQSSTSNSCKLGADNPQAEEGGDTDEGEGGERQAKAVGGDLDDAEEEDEEDGEDQQDLGQVRSRLWSLNCFRDI